MNSIIKFIEKNFFGLYGLHLSEYKKHKGAVILEKKDNEILVSFNPVEKLTFGKEFITTKIKEYELSPTSSIQVKNKIIYTMPGIDNNALTQKAEVIFFIIIDGNNKDIISGYPQLVTIKSKQYTQYQLIPEFEKPKINKDIKYGWLVGATQNGNDYVNYCGSNFDIDSFRSNFNFNTMFNLGEESFINKYFKRMLTFPKISEFAKNTAYRYNIGNPKLYNGYALDTLRYMNMLIEIEDNFNPLQTFFNFNIIEIGGGYGGLASIVSDYYKCKYTIIEIPELIPVIKSYLNKLDTLEQNNNNDNYKKNYFSSNINAINYENMTQCNNEQIYDLVISEFCLSELDDTCIKNYFDNTIIKSRNALIVCNIWERDKKKKFKKRFEEMFDIVEEQDVYPVSKWPNYLLICHQNKNIKV